MNRDRDLWFPHAVVQELPNAGPFTGHGRPKALWHTTEGLHYPGTSLYHNTQPHFTCDIHQRVIYQHIPIDRAAMALVHDGGETNRDNVVQTELVGYAAYSGEWSDADYHFIRTLSVWIMHHHGVRARHITPWGTHPRLTWAQWHNWDGHLGHMHAPENLHVDPGVHFQAQKII